jgi:hypothetical protein
MTPAHGSPVMKSLALVAGLVIGAGTAAAQGSTPTPTPDPAAPTPDPATSPPPDGGDPITAPVDTAPVDTMPAEPPPPEPAKDEPPPLHVSYDKGILFKTPDEAFEAKLSLRTQLRYELARSLEDGAETASRFYLPRVRLQLEGNAFGKETRYKLEVGFSERGSFTFTKDFFVERQVGKLWLRVGQWKRPFHRQEIVSDFASTFNERSIANEFVGGGRDVGFAVHNEYEKSPEGVEWVVGIFNGFAGGGDRPRITTTCEQDPVSLEITCTNAAATNFPTDMGPTLVARVGFNKGKVKGYTEMDLDGGPLRFGVAANYKVDLADLGKGAEESVGDNLSHAVGADAIVKVSGFDAMLSILALKVKTADLALAGLAQAGYVVVPKKVHVAGRFAFNKLVGTDNYLLEIRAAASYLYSGHSLKIATDVGLLKETGGGDPEIQVRIMPQLTF